MNALEPIKKSKVMHLVLLLTLLLVVLAGCSTKSNSVTIDGIEVTIDLENSQVIAGENTYAYVTDEAQIEIEYPNGMIFRRVYESDGTTDDWIKTTEAVDDAYLEKMGYLKPNVLINQVIRFSPDGDKTTEDSPSALGIFLITLGILNVAFPRWFWNIQYGWRYKNTEPTDIAINIQRLGGVVAIIVGFILLL